MKTDGQLQKDVSAELLWEPSIHPEEIGVQAHDGVVTLTGRVGSFQQKIQAETASQRVAGVRGLAVELQVMLTSLGLRDDPDIARSALTVLQWIGEPASSRVNVMVEHGWITLSGSVDWQYQRQAAEDRLRYLVGVTGLSNQIAIEPTVTLAAVKSEIEAALARQSHAAAPKISVKVDGSCVTLTGTAPSWPALNAARASAWAAPGVTRVNDTMTVAL